MELALSYRFDPFVDTKESGKLAKRQVKTEF